ncbi:perlucin-like protein [Ostrea edulis]|uniref:perlucin-like protein n=1 Tax=Ostrea edulis TaxID=37623 RepID=UPI002095CCBF|nr:perlucin-like protein [Ostrea edulis]
MGSVYRFVLLSALVAVLSAQFCPGGWYHHATSCYAFIDAEHLSWGEAMFYCSTLHANLVQIESSSENTFLKNHLFAAKTNASYWIGLTDAFVEGKYFWQTTQDEINFADWAPNEPNDAHHNEDCAVLGFGFHYRWNDLSCSHRIDFICERTLTSESGVLVG